MSEEQYLEMARRQYEADADRWSLQNRNPVVGSYDAHNEWADYDTVLFKGIDTNDKVALEYGCGPGRNIIRFRDRFARIDGVDIATNNLEKARVNLEHNGIAIPNLMLCDGKSIPALDETYDVVFSVICLQHIACYDIRLSIFKNIHRVLKTNGSFCFQMGYGGKPEGSTTAEYWENAFDAKGTNSAHDVAVRDVAHLENDLLTICGFKTFTFDIRPTGPGDNHRQWIWVRVQK
jgi:ubiquinone/menaquinone biosynthesis C-methylase UbiE